MRAGRRFLRALVVVLVLLIGTAAAGAILLQTACFKNRARMYVLAQAGKYLNGEISVDRLNGNLYGGLALEGVSISLDGQPVISAKDIALRYNLYQLITHDLTIDELRIDAPVVRVAQEGEGWTIAQLIKKQDNEADRQNPQSSLRIDSILISDGTVLVADNLSTSGVAIPKRLERIDAKLSFAYEPVHYSIGIDHVSFRASEPDLALNSFGGALAVRDDTLFLKSLAIRTSETSLSIDGAIQNYLTAPQLAITVASDKTSVKEIGRIVPVVADIDLQPAFEVTLNGPLDRLAVAMNVRSSAGQVTGTLSADLMEPGYGAKGDVSVQHLNLAPILNNPKQASDITARASIDVQSESLSNVESLKGTIKVAAPRIVMAGYTASTLNGTVALKGRQVDVNAHAAAYGATTSASGRLTIPDGDHPLAFDVRGQARHLDVQSLPRSLDVPRLATNINADYHIVGHADRSGTRKTTNVAAVVDARFDDSTIADARIANGSTVRIDMRGREIAYRANADISDVDLRQLGTSFGVKALADDRYRSRIDGHIEVNGRGTTIKTLQADAKGTIASASMMDGQLSETSFEASLANNRAHLKTTGTIANLDPSRVSGDTRLAGHLGGQFDLDAAADDVASGVTPDTVAGTAKLTVNRSTIGGLAIERASLDADYRDRSAEIRELEVVGPDANVSAHGTAALGDSGNSNLLFHVDSPRLAEIAGLFDVALSGIGSVDGTLTGNRKELQASGNLTGDGIAYQDNGALTLTSSYTAKIPDLDVKRAQVTGNSRATFVTIAGQQIDEVAGKTTYGEQRLDFNLTAAQPQRTASAAGSLLMHADHQEVHLEELSLKAGNQEWTLAQGQPATINYADDTVSLENVHLVSGDQAIVAEGRLGAGDSSIQVKANNVDLARVDQMLTRPPQFTGRLNASATIEGTRRRPVVSGEFQVAGGGFRQFTYESFGGTLRYENGGATIDAKLQQNADQWVTAKGYVPAALFTATRAESGTPSSGHVEPAGPADTIALAIDSSPLGLGIIQGFTNEVTNVRGTVEAHVKVIGAAADPHPTGAVTLANGAFTVASTGVSYSNVAGQIDLQPDRVHIGSITILDNHDSALTVTGDLAVHARDVGDVQLFVNADDFKIVDNQIGNLRVQGALELGGELRSPELKGDFAFSTGRLDLDEILAQIPSAYSTEAQTDPSAPAAQAAAQTAKEPPPQQRSVFEALRMNVRISVADDLIVNSSGIEVPGALIDLGALNVTLGGNLTATKDPSGTVRLTGAINTIRGTYEFQGRRFDVLRDGGIRFEGTEDFDPRLDLRTHRLINGVDARVDIRGTLKQPQVALSSTPPLEDADILALVVFNQPLNELGAGQQMSIVERAQSLATGAVAGALSKSIAKALNLETFQFDVAPANGTGPALTVGQQLRPNLYVKVQQGVGNVSTTNLLLEYAFTNWLRLQTNIQQGADTQQNLFQRSQGSGADLIFLFSK